MTNKQCCILPYKILIFSFCILLIGCDWYRKNKCEWFLVPEPRDASSVEPGWVALCARNYENNKQRCNLKSKLEFAREVFGKPFRYNSMKVKEGPYPKEVESIKVCEK